MVTIEWEDINQIESGWMRRAKIPGGWLVKLVEDVYHDRGGGGMRGGWDWRTSITFVPDPNHQWGKGDQDETA